jgi:hypothetical protein
MNEEQAKALRRPFPPEAVGKLPRITCRACSQSQSRVCGEHRKSRCGECGAFLTSAHIHLDYVGHAAVTDRLLEVDHEWTWAPMAHDDNGGPAFTHGGLWINLTVCGVTRPGFGDETNGTGPKEIIGDAIRNAAMRFGVALDLWSKQDLHAGDGDASESTDDPSASSFDPARDLLPGGIWEDDPATMSDRLAQLMHGLSPSVDWRALTAQLEGPRDRSFLIRLSNALTRIDDSSEGELVSDETIVEAFGWAFGQIVSPTTVKGDVSDDNG